MLSLTWVSVAIKAAVTPENTSKYAPSRLFRWPSFAGDLAIAFAYCPKSRTACRGTERSKHLNSCARPLWGTQQQRKTNRTNRSIRGWIMQAEMLAAASYAAAVLATDFAAYAGAA